jgi:hypothetical protein
MAEKMYLITVYLVGQRILSTYRRDIVTAWGYKIMRI